MQRLMDGLRTAPWWFLALVVLSAVMVINSAYGLANPLLFCSQCSSTANGIATDIVIGSAGLISVATGLTAIAAEEDSGLLIGSAIGFGLVAVALGTLAALATQVFGV